MYRPDGPFTTLPQEHNTLNTVNAKTKTKKISFTSIYDWDSLNKSFLYTGLSVVYNQ